MEEDIKILERMCDEIINLDDTSLFETLSPMEIAVKINGLINRVKELEKENKGLKCELSEAWEEWNNLERYDYEKISKLKKENKELKESNTIYALEGKNIKLEQYIKNNYIPKSKIKELLNVNIIRAINKNGEIFYNEEACIEIARALQEILEDK